jgi:hypothetical protein
MNVVNKSRQKKASPHVAFTFWPAFLSGLYARSIPCTFHRRWLQPTDNFAQLLTTMSSRTRYEERSYTLCMLLASMAYKISPHPHAHAPPRFVRNDRVGRTGGLKNNVQRPPAIPSFAAAGQSPTPEFDRRRLFYPLQKGLYR